MSSCCYGAGHGGGFMSGYAGGARCICDFPTLVILILIVLQFSKKNKNYQHDVTTTTATKDKYDQIGNGVLFIIAIFFLSCAGCGRR